MTTLSATNAHSLNILGEKQAETETLKKKIGKKQRQTTKPNKHIIAIRDKCFDNNLKVRLKYCAEAYVYRQQKEKIIKKHKTKKYCHCHCCVHAASLQPISQSCSDTSHANVYHAISSGNVDKSRFIPTFLFSTRVFMSTV